MSLLLTGPGGAAVPVPATLYGGTSAAASASTMFPGGQSWQSVPASGSLLSNIYSPVVAPQYPPAADGVTYINNGTISTGPWTSNSTRAFNVVSQNGPAIVPPACMTPYPRQYMPSVMGSLSRMAAVVPPIALQNTWWPVNQPSVYPSLVADVTPSASSSAPVWTPPQPPTSSAPAGTPPAGTPAAPQPPASSAPAGTPPAGTPPAPQLPTVILAQTGAPAPAAPTPAAATQPPPYYMPDSTISYVPSYMNMYKPAACAGNYVPWARPLQTAYVPYRPRYGFGV